MITKTSQAGQAIISTRMWIDAFDTLSDAPTPTNYDGRAHRDRERQIIAGYIIDNARALVDVLEVET